MEIPGRLPPGIETPQREHRMKRILSLTISAALLSACAATGPETAWGKPGITKYDYVTDMGTCTAKAAIAEGSDNGANTAGGMNGRNNSARGTSGADAGANQAPPGAATPVGGGGIYRDSAPADVVNRAATQQTTQQLNSQRLRVDAMKSCYAERGYQEFKLTPEQRAKLGSLEKGSNAYLQYLSDIATDPALLKNSVPVTPKSGS